jgi:Domain of unknown function (DUF4041)/T5orf172 domain
MTASIIAFALFLTGPLFIILWGISQFKLVKIRKKYAPIHSVEDEVDRLKKEVETISDDVEKVRNSYAEKRELLDRILNQVAIYDERLAFAELGIYEPHFDFNDSEAYKSRILEVRRRQKDMVSAKLAASAPTNWAVDGSASKGQTMINRQIRLTLRAFNNECEAAIANATWNNVVAMEKRILTATRAINKENESLALTISDEYVRLKLEELFLTHEYREQLKIEKDERADLVRAEREEKKLLEEAARAEREEQKYQALLDKARQEVGLDNGNQALKGKIALLEQQLAEAHSVTERARAMAEMTRSGYVYIISNVGSLGEDIVKIGLTRRLDPDDRVRELGDASVPFSFDIHAMIYSDEAPALEAALHNEFAKRRVNMSNFRKEFFRVTLQEVEEAVGRLAPKANFFKDREAQEWYETLARRNQLVQIQQAKAAYSFPESI